MGKNFDRFCEMMEKPAIILNGPTIIGSEKGVKSIVKAGTGQARLLAENQELKDKVAQLENEIKRLERKLLE